MLFRARNLVFLLFVAAFVFADESSKPAESEAKSEKKVTADPQPPPSTTQTPTPSSSSTTVTPITHPTTPNATTPATTTTTTSTTTTSTTTTIKPTTPPPTTTTSTEKPTPTTPPSTPKPTPTTPQPTPKPTPTPTIDNWTVKDTNGTVCITANMLIRITVPYMSIENKTVEATFKVDSVQNATATGSCSGTNTESLVLSWSNVTATFHFALNVTDHTYSLDSVIVAILVNNATFPNNIMVNVTEVQLVNKDLLFTVPQNNSYTCTTVPTLSMSGANNTVSGKLTVANVKVQAFGTDKSGKYRAPLDCASIDTPDIVPIAVGLILAGLVVVVLVAYLVGRRRAQARGYLSM